MVAGMANTTAPSDPAPARVRLLLLAGSGEAREIASALADRADLSVIASLLHPPRAFGPLAVPQRLGGFGGAEGFRTFLRDQGVTAVLDATHPFAHRISARTADICAELGVAYRQVLRPPWRPGPGDHWTEVPDEAAAAALIQPGQRVFTTTGRATQARFGPLPDVKLFVRRLRHDLPEPPMTGVTYIPDEGPFSVDDELETFRRLNIDVLVAKNSGGLASQSKLDAARRLGLPVILIARPAQPRGEKLETVAAALNWVDSL